MSASRYSRIASSLRLGGGRRAHADTSKGSGAASLRLIGLLALTLTATFALTASPAVAAEVHAFSSSFGSAGAGNGQLALTEQSGITINATSGDVYVADTGNDRVEQFTAAGAFVRTFGSLTTPTFIAIDNSTGASKGDVYVADSGTSTISKFDSAGNLIASWGSGGHLNGSTSTGGAFGELDGLAVSASGDLFVLSGGKRMSTFGQDGTFGEDFELEYEAKPRGFALDNSAGASSGDIYTFYASGPETLKFDSSGGLLGEPDVGGGTGLAVDASNGDLYVDHGTEVSRYDASSAALESFGSASPAGGSLVSAGALAISPSHGVYVANTAPSTIPIFTLQNAEPPTATISAPTEVAYTSAHVSGMVDPEGTATTCRFEYVTKAHFEANAFTGAETTPCTTNPGSGSTAEPVQAELSGLAPATTYRVRLAATSAGGTAYSAEPSPTFETKEVAKPSVSIEAPKEVGYRSARFTGHINPNAPGAAPGQDPAFDVSWHFQCSPECPGAEGQLEADNLSHEVTTLATGLHPGTPYEVSLVAENAGGSATSAGPNPSFETKAVAKPTVSIDPVTTFTGTTAHFSGHVNPNAPEAEPTSAEVEEAFKTEWRFRCTPECPGERSLLKADNTPHQVSADVVGLNPGTLYNIVLFAENSSGAEAITGPVAFTTSPIAPSVDSTFVSAVTGTTADLNAQINPNGASTTYHFEYITQTEFAAAGNDFGSGTQTTPESLPVGATTATQPTCTLEAEANGCIPDARASAHLTDLVPNTAYRFRVAASNSVQTNNGPAKLFATRSNAPASSGCPNETIRSENKSLNLPDCRAYERVSAADNAAVYGQAYFNAVGSPGGIALTNWPMQSSSDGDSVVYVGEAPISGKGEGSGNTTGGEGDQHFATRLDGGWVSADIQPRGSRETTYYESFSDDLRKGVLVTLAETVGATETPLSSDVETPCSVLYSRLLGVSPAYLPLFTTESSTCHRPFLVGASSDGSHQLFESPSAKTSSAVESPNTGLENNGHNNIYDAFGGQLHLVNVLPGPTLTFAPDATAGSLSEDLTLGSGAGPRLPGVNASNVISDDGSRVFWTDLATGNLYVRENPAEPQSDFDSEGNCTEATKACTVQLDTAETETGGGGEGRFWTASADGSRVYFTSAASNELTADTVANSGQNLYEYDFDKPEGERLWDLTVASSANVLGVVGVNDNGPAGSYLYFVAEGALSLGAEARTCAPASQGGTPQEEAEEAEGLASAGRGCNLYVIHGGETTFVATLFAGDNNFAHPPQHQGDWLPVLGLRSAQLSSRGTSLAFMSERRLTSYDNVNTEGKCGGGTPPIHSCAEVYLFDASTGQISCVSCDPTGVTPTADNHGGGGTFLPHNLFSLTRVKRTISDDGNRIFFDSDESLVSTDLSGSQDVYEWERKGTGTCIQGSFVNGGGCLYLLSGGTPGNYSTLIDADESGRNVFFVTREALANDRDEKPDLYDARVNGGFSSHLDAVDCASRDVCKGPFRSAPAVAFPGSGTFEENLPRRCTRGFVRKHDKCVRRHRKRSHKNRRAAGVNRESQR